MAMIRENLIQHKVLSFYKSLDQKFISLPFNIVGAIKSVPNVRLITYLCFSELHRITLEKVIKYAESNDGVTHYNKNTDQYIVLYNTKHCVGRRRFTLAHELGHIVLGHLEAAAFSKASINNFNGLSDTAIEREADWFASMLLCPFPVLRELNVNSPTQIKRIYF